MPSLLNDKDLKRLKNEMKGFTREFEINDRAFSMNLNKEVVERRRSIVDSYNKWSQMRTGMVNSADAFAKRRALRDGIGEFFSFLELSSIF